MSNHKFNLYKLAWPVFISQISAGLVGFVDVAFFSQVNEDAAGAVGIVFPYLLIAFMLLPILATVGITVAAQLTGARQTQLVSAAYFGNILLCTIIGAVLGVFTWFNAEQIGLWFQLSDELNHYISEYLLWMSGSYLLLAVSSAYAAIIAVKGKTVWNMYVAMAGNLLNILLDAVLVFGWFGIEPMGIKGIAIASLSAYLLGLLLNVYLVHAVERIRFTRDDLAKQKRVFLLWVKVGPATMVEPMSYVIQQMVVMAMVAYLGVTAMAANTFVWRLLFVELAVGGALATAAQIMLGHYAGSRDYPLAYETLSRSLKLGCSFALGNVVLLIVFRDQLLGLFTSQPEVINLGFQLLLMCLIMEPFRQINIIVGRALKAVGDATFSAAVGIGAMIFVVPVAYMIGIRWEYGLLGVWAAFLGDEILRGSVNLWRWRSGRWHEMAIIEQAPATS